MENNTKRFNIFTWIKQYPIKFLIFVILFVIPILGLTLAGIKYRNDNMRFYFDKIGDKPNYLNQKDVSSQDEINKYFKEFSIKLTEIKIDKLDDSYNEQYKFDVNVAFNSSYADSLISYRFLLATDFYDKQSEIETKGNSKNYTISVNYPFNHKDNKTKFLFLKSGKPNLYVEVKLTIPPNNSLQPSEEVVLIYKLNINNQKGYDVY